MILVWTKNNKVGSRLIRWGTDSDTSHFSIVFADHIVLEAKSPVVGLDWLGSFVKRQQIVHMLAPKIPFTLDEEFEIIEPIINDVIGKPYDYKGLIYLGWRVALKKAFKIPLPAYNKWNNKRQYFCVELSEAAKEVFITYFNVDFENVAFDLLTPSALYNILSQSNELYELDI